MAIVGKFVSKDRARLQRALHMHDLNRCGTRRDCHRHSYELPLIIISGYRRNPCLVIGLRIRLDTSRSVTFGSQTCVILRW